MTNGSFIVQDTNTFDGYVQPITAGGSLTFNFSVRVASVLIHNYTEDFIEIIPVTVPGALGNGIIVIPPASSQSISNTPEVVFQSIDVNDLQLTGKGGGWIVVNGFFS